MNESRARRYPCELDLEAPVLRWSIQDRIPAGVCTVERRTECDYLVVTRRLSHDEFVMLLPGERVRGLAYKPGREPRIPFLTPVMRDNGQVVVVDTDALASRAQAIYQDALSQPQYSRLEEE